MTSSFTGIGMRPDSNPQSLGLLRPDENEISTSSTMEDFRRPSLLWIGGILLLGIVPATLIDVPLARAIANFSWPNWVGQALDGLSLYATPWGLAAIVLFLALVLRRRRWTTPRLATLAAGGGAVATLAKLFVLRPRPNALPINSSAYDYAWVWSFDPTLSRVASFEPAMRAFPSATLAMATALTVGLWIVVPRLRWIGLVCCVGTMLHRLQCNAHFSSDLLGSAAIGLWWAYACFHPKLLGGLFDRFEDQPKGAAATNIDSAPSTTSAATSATTSPAPSPTTTDKIAA